MVVCFACSAGTADGYSEIAAVTESPITSAWYTRVGAAATGLLGTSPTVAQTRAASNSAPAVRRARGGKGGGRRGAGPRRRAPPTPRRRGRPPPPPGRPALG